MLCGSFSESKDKELRLDDVEIRVFVKNLDLWYGEVDALEIVLHEVRHPDRGVPRPRQW